MPVNKGQHLSIFRTTDTSVARTGSVRTPRSRCSARRIRTFPPTRRRVCPVRPRGCSATSPTGTIPCSVRARPSGGTSAGTGACTARGTRHSRFQYRSPSTCKHRSPHNARKKSAGRPCCESAARARRVGPREREGRDLQREQDWVFPAEPEDAVDHGHRGADEPGRSEAHGMHTPWQGVRPSALSLSAANGPRPAPTPTRTSPTSELARSKLYACAFTIQCTIAANKPGSEIPELIKRLFFLSVSNNFHVQKPANINVREEKARVASLPPPSTSTTEPAVRPFGLARVLVRAFLRHPNETRRIPLLDLQELDLEHEGRVRRDDGREAALAAVR